MNTPPDPHEPELVDVVEGRSYPRREHLPCPLCGARRVPRAIPVAFGMTASVAECPPCRIAWQTPRPQAGASRAYMDWRWRGYGARDRYVEDRANQLRRARVQVDHLRGVVAPGARLLDFGAGAGAFVHAARQAGYCADGVEQSAAARQRARDSYGVELAESPGAARYDVVTLWDVVEHLRDPAGLLALLAGHLEPGGVLFVETGNWENWRRIAERDRWGLYFYDHQFYFSPASLAALLGRCGYEDFALLDANRRRPRLSLLHPKRLRRDPGLLLRSWREWLRARRRWPEHGDIDVMVTRARRVAGTAAALAVALLGLGVLAAPPPAAAGEFYERDWIEARSPNFVVLSAVDRRRTSALVQELEDFRTLVGALTNAAVLDARVPTRIFVFAATVPEIGLVHPVAGFLHPGMRANYAAVRKVPGMPLGMIVQHEYTHYLMRNQNRQAYPRWYDEGFAELLSTASLSDGKFDFGNASAGRLATLYEPGAWLPFERLLDDERLAGMSRDDAYRFYAQSWALVHYLTWGKPGFQTVAALRAYLADRESGTAAVPAFEKAFGEDVAGLSRVLLQYLGKARYSTGRIKNPFDPAGIQVREVPADVVAAEVAHLCLVRDRHDSAAALVAVALRLNPRNARALVDQARLHALAGRFAEAEALYPQAIALEPESELHHLDFGEYWLERAGAAADDAQRRGFLSSARAEFVRANRINGRNPETLAMYGSSFMLPGEDPARGTDTLQVAHDLLPSEPRIRTLLARNYLAVDRPADARPLLRAVVAWEDGEIAQAARQLLAQIGPAQAPPVATPPAGAP